MKKFLTVLIALCGLSLVAVDAEAKRLGGGKSMGTQRNMTQQAAPQGAGAATAIAAGRRHAGTTAAGRCARQQVAGPAGRSRAWVPG